jgi:hypothetical protein
MERLGRLCVGLGLIWGIIIVGYWLMVGIERPEDWTPWIDKAMSAGVRLTLYSLLTFVVTPIGMLMLLRDVFVDETPLWLKLASPGVFVSLYVLLLAAAVPDAGQPLLLRADPVVQRVFPSMELGKTAIDSVTWLARFGGMLLVLAVLPGLVGLVLGLLTGTNRKRWSP